MPLLKRLAAMAIFTVALSGAVEVHAHEHQLGDLTIVHAWSRATAPSQKAGGVFLKIINSGDQPDRLIAIESEMADVGSLHATISEGDILKMRPVEGGIEVPANGEAVLAPGGQHVMLIGLRKQLVEETTIPLTLIFERAGRFEIMAVVESAGARGPAGADHGQHGTAAGTAK